MGHTLQRIIYGSAFLVGLALCIKITCDYSQVGSDFTQDYVAATALRRNIPIYGQNIEQLSLELTGFAGVLNFHPPFVSLLFVPISYLPYQTAFFSFNLMSLLIMWLMVAVIGRELAFKRGWILWVACALLYWFPVHSSLGLGQVSTIISACLVAAWYFDRYGKSWRCGLALALATQIKLFPAFLLFYLLARKRWSALGAFIFFSVLLSLITVWRVGYEQIFFYIIHIIGSQYKIWGAFPLNHSLTGIVGRLLGWEQLWTPTLAYAPHLAHGIVFCLCVLLTLITAVMLLRLPPKPIADNAAYSLTVVTMLLVSPLTWSHIFTVLLLPLALHLKDRHGALGSHRAWFFLALLLISLPDVLIFRGIASLFEHTPPWYITPIFSLPAAGLMIIWLSLMRTAQQLQSSA